MVLFTGCGTKIEADIAIPARRLSSVTCAGSGATVGVAFMLVGCHKPFQLTPRLVLRTGLPPPEAAPTRWLLSFGSTSMNESVQPCVGVVKLVPPLSEYDRLLTPMPS